VTVFGVLLALAVPAGAARRIEWRGAVAVRAPHAAHRFEHRPRFGRRRRHRARSAIVGGDEVSIDRAPWQVALLGEIQIERAGKQEILLELCGGAILSEMRVVTAAHCMFNPVTGVQAPAEDFLIVAGSSDLAVEESTEQDVAVASVRVHPYFRYAAGPGGSDDLAILRLTKALSLAGPATRAIGVTSASSTPPASTPVEFSGFGQQSASFEPNGKLYSMSMTLRSSEQCGGEADAVFLCASTLAGSACGGDSGGGLTSAGTTPALIGLLSMVEVISGNRCQAGADNGFVNLTAPEIRDFIENENSFPPEAPRGGLGVSIHFAGAEQEAVCEPGSWSGAPTLIYTFLDGTDGQMLQSGSSSTYRFTSSDMGRTIYCQVQASNPGGVAVERTATLGPIPRGLEAWVALADQEAADLQVRRAEEARKAQEAANQPPAPLPIPRGEWCGEEGNMCPSGEVALAGTRIVVRSDGMASLELDCLGSESCSGKLTLSAKTTFKAKSGKKRSRIIAIGTARFSIVAGKTAVVKIKLDGAGRSLLHAAHGRLVASLAILELAHSPENAYAKTVRLVQQDARRKGVKR
jgi:hypothetical protein